MEDKIICFFEIHKNDDDDAEDVDDTVNEDDDVDDENKNLQKIGKISNLEEGLVTAGESDEKVPSYI